MVRWLNCWMAYVLCGNHQTVKPSSYHYFLLMDRKNITKQIMGKIIFPIPPGACPVVSIGLKKEIPNRPAHSMTSIKYIKGINDLYLKATIT